MRSVDKFIVVKKLQVRRCRRKSNVTETEQKKNNVREWKKAEKLTIHISIYS